MSCPFARQHLDRQGFALVATLLAIVLIGALVAGALFATTEETKVGATGVAREIGLMAAESAIAATVSGSELTLPVTIGMAGIVSQRMDISGRQVDVYVTRLDSTVYWFVAEALPDPAHAGTHRRVGLLVTAVRQADSSMSIRPISERAWSELF